MEFVDGLHIGSSEFRRDGFETDELASLCLDILQGIEYIHQSKKIHRDIKLENLLISSRGVIKIVDFGISACLKHKSKRSTQVGTPLLMAPEIIMADEDYDEKVDIWSFGICALMLADPRHSLFKEDPLSIFHKITAFPSPKPSHSEYPKIFADFLSKCLTKEPSKRPSATELLKHPFLGNVKLTKTKTLKKLAKRVIQHRKMSNGIEESEVDDESLLRISLPDETFRTQLAHKDETCETVLTKLLNKLGFLYIEANYRLYVRLDEKGLFSFLLSPNLFQTGKKSNFWRATTNQFRFLGTTKKFASSFSCNNFPRKRFNFFHHIFSTLKKITITKSSLTSSTLSIWIFCTLSRTMFPFVKLGSKKQRNCLSTRVLRLCAQC